MSAEAWQAAGEPIPPGGARWWRVLLVIATVLVVLCGGSGLVLARIGRPLVASAFVATTDERATGGEGDESPDGAAAAAELDKLRPKGAYIVVDTYRNRLRLYKDGQLLRTAVCSTGTGRVLRDPRTGRQWIFDTPLGERVVKNKQRNPVWDKPDWAFIEDGFLPPRTVEERLEPGALGDYGLYMGDGYIIHGTLFKTLLGLRVTHGCIRLGDEDLEFVYKHVPVGSRVYLY